MSSTKFSTSNSDVFNMHKPVYYLTVVSLHLYMLKWHDDLYPQPYYQKVCYLTLLSFFLNLGYYSWMLIDSLKIIKKNFDTIESCYFKLAFCLSFVVFTLFWAMIMFDRNMVVDPDNATPTFLNCFTHGGNFILNIFEHLYVKPRGDATRINIFFFAGFMVIYSSTLKLVASLTGFAAYPFVEKAPIFHYFIVNLIGLGLVCMGDKAFRMIIKKEFLELKQSNLVKSIKA